MSVRLRPTFSFRSDVTAKAAIENVRAAVTAHQDSVQGQFTDRHALISIVESRRHFWSPWLNLAASDIEQGCEISGRFSPHPTIWTAFMFAYFSLAVLSFFSVIIGLSQQLAGQMPWGYALLPAFLLLGLILWAASQTGQKLADSEMRELKTIIFDCTTHSPS